MVFVEHLLYAAYCWAVRYSSQGQEDFHLSVGGQGQEHVVFIRCTAVVSIGRQTEL